MENIVAFRRHILESENPLYRKYTMQTIPKYQPNFFGTWEPRVYLNDNKVNDVNDIINVNHIKIIKDISLMIAVIFLIIFLFWKR